MKQNKNWKLSGMDRTKKTDSWRSSLKNLNKMAKKRKPLLSKAQILVQKSNKINLCGENNLKPQRFRLIALRYILIALSSLATTARAKTSQESFPSQLNLNNQTSFVIKANHYFPSTQGVQIPPNSSPLIQWTQFLSNQTSQIDVPDNRLQNCKSAKILKDKKNGQLLLVLICPDQKLGVFNYKPTSTDSTKILANNTYFADLKPPASSYPSTGIKVVNQACTNVRDHSNLKYILVYCQATLQDTSTKESRGFVPFLMVLRQKTSLSLRGDPPSTTYLVNPVTQFSRYQGSGTRYLSPKMPFAFNDVGTSGAANSNNKAIFGVNVELMKGVPSPMGCISMINLATYKVTNSLQKPLCFALTDSNSQGLVKSTKFICGFSKISNCLPTFITLVKDSESAYNLNIVIKNSSIFNVGGDGKPGSNKLESNYPLKLDNPAAFEGSHVIVTKPPSLGAGYYAVVDLLSEVIILELMPRQGNSPTFELKEVNRIKINAKNYFSTQNYSYYSTLEIREGFIVRKIYKKLPSLSSDFQVDSVIQIHPKAAGFIDEVAKTSVATQDLLAKTTDAAQSDKKLSYVGLVRGGILHDYGEGLNFGVKFSSKSLEVAKKSNQVPTGGVSFHVLGLDGSVIGSKTGIKLNQNSSPTITSTKNPKLEALYGKSLSIQLGKIMKVEAANAELSIPQMNQTFSRSQKLSLSAINQIGSSLHVQGEIRFIRWMKTNGTAILQTTKTAYFCRLLPSAFPGNQYYFKVLSTISGLKYSQYQPILQALSMTIKKTCFLLVYQKDFLNKRTIFRRFQISETTGSATNIDESAKIPFEAQSVRLFSPRRLRRSKGFFLVYGLSDKVRKQFNIMLSRFTIQMGSSATTLGYNYKKVYMVRSDNREPISIDIQIISTEFLTGHEIWVNIALKATFRDPLEPEGEKPSNGLIRYVRTNEVAHLRLEPTYEEGASYLISSYFEEASNSFVARCFIHNSVFYVLQALLHGAVSGEWEAVLKLLDVFAELCSPKGLNHPFRDQREPEAHAD